MQYTVSRNFHQFPPIINNEFGFTGEQWDAEAGLQYLRARYYDPEIGRFINRDSIFGDKLNPISLNKYTYAWNNPVNNTDPSGNRPDRGDFSVAHPGISSAGSIVHPVAGELDSPQATQPVSIVSAPKPVNNNPTKVKCTGDRSDGQKHSLQDSVYLAVIDLFHDKKFQDIAGATFGQMLLDGSVKAITKNILKYVAKNGMKQAVPVLGEIWDVYEIVRFAMDLPDNLSNAYYISTFIYFKIDLYYYGYVMWDARDVAYNDKLLV